MQVHGSAEARTHIIIDYNRNGIVNQIALNGSDFKMGFIIAGAPNRVLPAKSGLSLSLLLLSAFGESAVAEVTFNAIIYEFIFFAPPNRTLNAVCSGAVLVSVSVSIRGPYCWGLWNGGYRDEDGVWRIGD